MIRFPRRVAVPGRGTEPRRAPSIRPLLILVPALAAGLSAASCSDWGDRLAVLDGNAAFARGDRQEALARYLRAAPGPVRDYDVANVYATLDEPDAARTVYAAAAETGDPAAAFAALYNLGLLELGLGRPDAAVASLRAALRLRSADLEAKRALELAVEAARKRKAADAPSLPPAAEAPPDGGDELFRMLREFETGRFRAPEPAPSAPAPDDH